MCQGGYLDMSRVEKMGCRAKSEIVFRALRVRLHQILLRALKRLISFDSTVGMLRSKTSY